MPISNQITHLLFNEFRDQTPFKRDSDEGVENSKTLLLTRPKLGLVSKRRDRPTGKVDEELQEVGR